jgi:phosphoglycolate phosphatase-like HAD superfamily hydrolase
MALGVVMALLLFDIDGTLLRPLGLGHRAFHDAVHSLYGRAPEKAPFPYAGLLDTEIAARTLAGMGLPHDEAATKALLEAYVACLEKSVPPPHEECLCPGVPEILDEASSRGHHVALLTGNLHAGARIKLRFCGLLGQFRMDAGGETLLGAFADDAAERSQLVPVAVDRCRRRFRRDFPPSETWIVGDSPRDVQAARASGIRCAAVATGFTELENLRSLDPDLAIADLRQSEAFFAAVRRMAA